MGERGETENERDQGGEERKRDSERKYSITLDSRRKRSVVR